MLLKWLNKKKDNYNFKKLQLDKKLEKLKLNMLYNNMNFIIDKIIIKI